MGLDAIVCVRVVDGGAVSEVLDGLTRLDGASEKDGILSLGCLKGELIEGDALSAGLNDSGSSSLSKTKGGNGERGKLKKTRVVGNTSNNHGSLAILALE